MSLEIDFTGPVYQDNYVYFLNDIHSKNTIVIDPPPEGHAQKYLDQKNRRLVGILNTHHHPDHCGGISELKAKWNCPVWGPNESPISTLFDHYLSSGDTVGFFETPFSIQILLGHASPLISYYSLQHSALFCSDILFSLGCGRNFQGSLEDLFESLQWIKTLPDDTLIFCSHEYTVQNGNFALNVEPENEALQKRHQQAKHMRDQGRPTIPSTLAEEKLCNPFLRTDQESIRRRFFRDQWQEVTDLEVFKKLRKKKDHF
ncbi:MAG: hydroxyacylglutathione hydrolase [Bdellovibrionales bacterium]|nr:hydroxyacylglutathione hydrolase [Bdellovibrionales bacterium]